MIGVSTFTFVLGDQGSDAAGRIPMELSVEADNYGAILFAKHDGLGPETGYGTAMMAPGRGGPVAVQYVDGELHLLVWADINKEEPTHSISLEGAREYNRK